MKPAHRINLFSVSVSLSLQESRGLEGRDGEEDNCCRKHTRVAQDPEARAAVSPKEDKSMSSVTVKELELRGKWAVPAGEFHCHRSEVTEYEPTELPASTGGELGRVSLLQLRLSCLLSP